MTDWNVDPNFVVEMEDNLQRVAAEHEGSQFMWVLSVGFAGTYAPDLALELVQWLKDPGEAPGSVIDVVSEIAAMLITCGLTQEHVHPSMVEAESILRDMFPFGTIDLDHPDADLG